MAADQMPSAYQEIAASGGCVVSTSPCEGFGLALLEAQACGCPVIGPDVHGVNECVSPERGGVLYPSTTEPEQVAALIVQTLRDVDGMRKCVKECSVYVRQQFGLERMVQEYLRIYEGVPASATRPAIHRHRAPRLLSPLWNWNQYVEHHWSVGHYQYAMSEKLAKNGQWKLARTASRASLATTPTLYLKPKRLAFLIETQIYGAWHGDDRLAPSAPCDAQDFSFDNRNPSHDSRG
jgi:hypothetical protein